MTSRRPRLTPAIADVRRAVREALALSFPELTPAAVPALEGTPVSEAAPVPEATPVSEATPVPEPVEGPLTSNPLVLVGLSGGADSLALAAATAFEAPRAGIRAGAIIVDHALQDASAEVAERAAEQARGLGLDPVIVTRVQVGTVGGPEAAAREARYRAFADALGRAGASAVLLGHTLDDQAETVLLGLARGSGPASLQGMAPATSIEIRHMGVRESNEPPDGGSQQAVRVLRPLLGVRRSSTEAFCVDSGLEAWHDPHNSDPAYTRVRVRTQVLPMLEQALGPGVADALARTAEQLREDSEALDHFAEEVIEDLAEHAEAGISLAVGGLQANPPALRQRIIRLAVAAEFGVTLSRQHTLEVSRLVTQWRGQGPLHLPGIRVERHGNRVVFSAAT